jgi:hypothetical protein
MPMILIALTTRSGISKTAFIRLVDCQGAPFDLDGLG